MIKYQNHSHYKLPITTNPLEYGKLIEQIGNKYIIQLNTFNILIINEKDNENFIKLFRKGEFMFEFKDSKITENTFIRLIQDQKYTFKNSRLISTEIISVYGNILIYPLYEDTNSVKSINPFLEPEDYIPVFNFLFKNIKDPLIAFLVWEFCLCLFFYIIFVILQYIFIDNEYSNSLTLFSLFPKYDLFVNKKRFYSIKSMKGNIVKLRRSVNRN